MTYRERWEALPKIERAAIQELVKCAAPEHRERAQRAALAVTISRRKAQMNRRSDREARVLVGARIPRDEAFAIEQEAKRRGQSVYRFVRETLYREAHWRF